MNPKVYIKKNWFNILLNIVLGSVCLLGIYTSFFMNSVNRALALDEAILAVDFTQRSLTNLTESVFSWNQSAPAGWLYIVKIIAMLFGHTEYVYRLFSVISYVGVLVMLYITAKKVLRMEYPIIPCAFVASMEFILKYSNIFKPYMADAMFVLLVLYLFYLYEEKKINYIVLAVFWALLLWFSNPVCFVEGGLILAQVLFSCGAKVWNKLKEILIVTATIVMSFVVYYFYWLREVAQGDTMQNYWADRRFPLIINSEADLELVKELVDIIYVHFGYSGKFMLIMTGVAFIIAIAKKNKYVIGIYFGIFVSLFASSISMFPISDRLWLFYYPLISIVVFGVFESLEIRDVSTKFVKCILGLICILLVISNQGIQKYKEKENVYWLVHETNLQYEYLEEHMDSDAGLYVYSLSSPGFRFKNGYDNIYFKDNTKKIIFGTSSLEVLDEQADKEIEAIRSRKKCYIMLSGKTASQTELLQKELCNDGFLELVHNEYYTPIYYYCADVKDSKVSVEIESLWRDEKDGMTKELIKIHNTGMAYINHKYEKMYLVDEKNNIYIEIPENIKPGECKEFGISYQGGVEPNFSLASEYRIIGSVKK